MSKRKVGEGPLVAPDSAPLADRLPFMNKRQRAKVLGETRRSTNTPHEARERRMRRMMKGKVGS